MTKRFNCLTLTVNNNFNISNNNNKQKIDWLIVVLKITFELRDMGVRRAYRIFCSQAYVNLPPFPYRNTTDFVLKPDRLLGPSFQ